jgi:hypothetical protein
MRSRGRHRLALYLGLAEPDAQDRAEAANDRPAPLPRIVAGALIGGATSGVLWALLSTGSTWSPVVFGAAMGLVFLGLNLFDRRRALQRERQRAPGQ